MTPVVEDKANALAQDVLSAFDEANGGVHAGFRPAHAKGLLVSGVFTPSAEALSLTRAPHIQGPSTPVWVRFSDFAGIPAVADNVPEATPNGIAIRFYLAEHVHTDIIGHAVNGFPARTAEGLAEFLRAVATSGPNLPKPTPIETFLATHPSALEFVQAAGQSIPASFVKESFFAVTAYRFTNQDGVTRYGRYRIYPDGNAEILGPAAAAAKSPDYLFEDLKQRLAAGKPKMHIAVQLAEASDVVDDSTIHWPADRPTVEFGTIELSAVVSNNDAEQQHIIFDPLPRVDGIEPSADPLLQPRADVYLLSGRRRRKAGH
jgi:catalase